MVYYREENKIAFLNGYENENTRKMRRNVFVNSARTELLLGKDLYEFNLEEIQGLLYKMNASTKNSVKNCCRLIKDYIDWAIKLGYRVNKVNPIIEIPYYDPADIDGPDDWYNQFVIAKKTLFSEKEVKDAENFLINTQDKVIVRCAFLGISIRELLNLKEEHVYPVSNRLELNDGERSRTIVIDEESMNIIKDAINSEWYYPKNGKSLGKRTVDKLVENDYVVKISASGRYIHAGKTDGHVVYQRLSQVTKLDEIYKYFSYGNIAKSGRVKWARDNYDRFREINTKFLREIAEHFGFEKIRRNNTMDYNVFPMKQYISEEVLDELYPDREKVERL